MKSSTGDKVDETIEAVSDWIQLEIKNQGPWGEDGNLPSTIKALADLVAARMNEGRRER